jgi:hypothetical protein
VFGRLLADRPASPAALPASDFAVRVIETEVGVDGARLLASGGLLAGRSRAVEVAFPSFFELVDSARRRRKLARGGDRRQRCTAPVHGPAHPGSRADLAALEMVSSEREVTAVRGERTGLAALALHWLANALAQQGRGLAAGGPRNDGLLHRYLRPRPGTASEPTRGARRSPRRVPA